VSAGGVLLTDCRTGVKDESNLCHDRTLPGLLSEPLGITIEEYGSLSGDMQYAVIGRGDLKGRYAAVRYVDWVTPQGAEVLADYDQWHLKPFAAVTRNRFGKGAAYYVGTVIKEAAFYDSLMAQVLATARVKPLIVPPLGVEASIRQGGGKRLVFLVNHTEERQSVRVPSGMPELLSGRTTGETIDLDVYGVAVIKLPAR